MSILPGNDHARDRAEQLAAEKYPIIAINGVPSGYAVRNAFIDGYLTAQTITAEELEEEK